MSKQSKLNPETIVFNVHGSLQSWSRSSVFPLSPGEIRVSNQVFSGALRIKHVCSGSGHADVFVEITSGPQDFVGKTAYISGDCLNEALASMTLYSDASGYYIEGNWVFKKRGQFVRLVRAE